MDSKYDVQHYYLEYGLNEDKLPSFIWKEKVYGYFRDMMDSGIEDKLIIKCIREAIINKINDSRDLPLEFITLMQEEFDLDLDRYPFFIPDISIELLRKFKNGYICGGGKHQCLREITLFMNALNIRYKELQDFIY